MATTAGEITLTVLVQIDDQPPTPIGKGTVPITVTAFGHAANINVDDRLLRERLADTLDAASARLRQQLT